MRVIAGSRKRLPLKSVPGMNTRPTTDRIKETIFNMMADDIYDCNFLDLFAGSGQMGIEALSRGANKAYFVEKDKKAIQCIKENLTFTKFLEQSVVMGMDIKAAALALKGKEQFDIIFVDPPYHLELETLVLQQIFDCNLLAEEGYVVFEADINTDFSFADKIGFDIIREKSYKTNKHVFLVRKK